MSDRIMQWQNAFSSMPLIAILRGIQPDECVEIAQVLFDAGFNILEVPLNSPEPFVSIKRLTLTFPEKIVGAGTVLSEGEVAACVESDSKLVVAPNFNPAIARAVKQTGMIYCPGVATPTEAFAAIESGADGLKLFPAEMISPAIVKAMRAVLPKETHLIPVGGISTDNMQGYHAAGADGFGIGSALYKPGKTLSDIRSSAREFVSAYRTFSTT